MAFPEFPPPFVIERTRSLGFATGPWRRETLVTWLGEPMADKYISEAKAAGWLVSPYRGTYYIPAAQDLTVVSWLPEPARTEFLISRTLTVANLPYWCLSAWCRDRGLELGQPVFVTDIGVGAAMNPAPGNPLLDRKALRAKAQRVSERLTTIPFLDGLVIVALMPPASDQPQLRTALVPEDSSIEARREKERILGTAVVGLIALGAWALKKDFPGVIEAVDEVENLEKRARGVQYAVGAQIEDQAWILALLASLGTPRVDELMARVLKGSSRPEAAAVQRWAGMMGPPQPNSGWKETIRDGPYPYLLVPPALWSEMGADQAARRFRMLERLGGS